MTEDRIEYKPEDIHIYMECAKELRAEAIREFFSDFRVSVKSFFGRFQHTMEIPRTEQI